MESDIPKESIYTIYETENGSKKIECITQRPDNKIQKNTNIRKAISCRRISWNSEENTY